MQHPIDKKAVADSFSKAAHHYDQFAQLQRDIGYKLLNNVTGTVPHKVMDLGCGTGYFSEKLRQCFPNASLTCFDLSFEMLKQTRKREITNVHYQQGDIDRLPFAENSVDLIFSNLVLQWSEHFSLCLEQIKNSLKKEGRAYISTLLAGTLDELTQAWKKVDEYPHTNKFLTISAIQEALSDMGFSAVSVKTETRIVEYENVLEVMRSLKGIGANHVHETTSRSPTISGRKLIKYLQEGYRPFVNDDGRLNLTYVVCYIEVIK